MTTYERAVTAAFNAALAVSESEAWALGKIGAQAPAKKAMAAWQAKRGEFVQFALDNRLAPAEALWIRGGALGFHDGAKAFADLPRLVRLAFETWQRVLIAVTDALDQDAAEAAAAEERTKRDAEAAARAAEQRRPLSDADLEDTPLERAPDPLGPSDIARGR